MAPWREVRTTGDLRAAVEAFGLPLRLKAATGGYDGRSQIRIATIEDVDGALERLGRPVESRLLAEHPPGVLLERLITQDAGLAYKLVRLANSAYVGNRTSVASAQATPASISSFQISAWSTTSTSSFSALASLLAPTSAPHDQHVGVGRDRRGGRRAGALAQALEHRARDLLAAARVGDRAR